MHLSPAQTTYILDRLNDEATVEKFVQLNTTHPERERWVSCENEPYDTAFSGFRSDHLRWLDERLEDWCAEQRDPSSQSDGEARLHRLVTVTDFYFYSGENPAPSRRGRRECWLSDTDLPLACFLILDTVFSFSFTEKCWSARPWLGVKDDPLLALPYSRKYDRERAERAERQQRHDWERLRRAADLIGLLSRRIEQIDLRDIQRFHVPEYADIHAELATDDLGLAACGLMAYANTIHFDLWDLPIATHGQPWNERAQKPGPPIAQGAYEGALREIKYLSDASVKKMCLVALDALLEEVWRITQTPWDEEWDERQQAIREFRLSVGLAVDETVTVD